MISARATATNSEHTVTQHGRDRYTHGISWTAHKALAIRERMCTTTHAYTVSGGKETNMFSVISSIKLWRFWRNVVCIFWLYLLQKCKSFPPHLNNVFIYTTWWNLKCSLRTCYNWVVREKNSIIHSNLAAASKFARFESNWLQPVCDFIYISLQY